jgi:hypothetical protein
MEPEHDEVDERAYLSAMREMQALSSAERGTAESDRLQVLRAYVVAYQAQHSRSEGS